MTVRTQYESFWMFWVFFFGLVLFLPGLIIFVWDFFGFKAPKPGRPSGNSLPVSGKAEA